LICFSNGAKSRRKSIWDQKSIKSNGDLGEKGDGKIWSKVESGKGRGGFEMAQLICQVLKSQKEKK
jgi:hypothetical protein